jgi:hypothetical protein
MLLKRGNVHTLLLLTSHHKSEYKRVNFQWINPNKEKTMHISSLLHSLKSSVVLVFSLSIEALGFLGEFWSYRLKVYFLEIAD